MPGSDQLLDYEVIERCRSCSSPDLDVVLDLGRMPLSDALVPAASARADEPKYPLTLVYCGDCSLVQILETVNPDVLYRRDYPYYSSFSDELVANARSNVEQILAKKSLDATSLAIELASNDGYLLQWFAQKGIAVLGIDPAEGPAETARTRGIPTICEFFDVPLAEKLASDGVRADVIIGNNVLAHVPNQNTFVSAIEKLLSPDGLVVMEFPYVRDLVDHLEFDTIYHEHHCYFSVATVQKLFGRHGLSLISVEHLSIHGGSLRVSFRRDGEPDDSVRDFLEAEYEAGLDDTKYYEDFAIRVRKARGELVALLENIKAEGATIAAYGAAAKGAILLNFCGIDRRLIDFVVDRNTHKHGLEMPGVPVEIHGPEILDTYRPDYLLLLAWNFKDEIMSQQAWYAEQGGRFIVPIPTPTVV